MSKIVRVGVQRAEEYLCSYHGEKRRLGLGPKRALSIDTYFIPLGDVNDFISTLVRLCRAMPPCFRVES